MTLRSAPNAAAAAFALTLATNPAAAAALVAKYAKPTSPIGAVSIVRTAHTAASALITPAERKGRKAPKPAKEDKSPRMVVVDIPATGGLDAAGFLAGLRLAGKRPATYDVAVTDPTTGEIHEAGSVRLNAKGEPIMVWDALEQKKDERACMIAFCGYSSGEAHGEQLDRARMLAQSTLRTVARKAAGLPIAEYSYRSPAAYAVRQEGTEGFVKGMPNPIRVLGLDLCKREEIAAEELDLFGDLRAHLAAGEDVEFSVKLLTAFPYERGVREVNRLVSRPIKGADGKTVKGVDGRVQRHTVEVPGDYEVIAVPGPVVASLLPHLHAQESVDGGVDGFKFRADSTEALDAELADLEVLAYERLDQIGADLDSLESGGYMDPEAVKRVSESLHGRGMVATIDEALRIYDPASRSHAVMGVGTTVSRAAIERDTASDAHGILNTAPKA